MKLKNKKYHLERERETDRQTDDRQDARSNLRRSEVGEGGKREREEKDTKNGKRERGHK